MARVVEFHRSRDGHGDATWGQSRILAGRGPNGWTGDPQAFNDHIDDGRAKDTLHRKGDFRVSQHHDFFSNICGAMRGPDQLRM
jgi:hypothetical protein